MAGQTERVPIAVNRLDWTTYELLWSASLRSYRFQLFLLEGISLLASTASLAGTGTATHFLVPVRGSNWTNWTFCLRTPFVTDDVFVCHFQLQPFVFNIARSSRQLFQHIHAKTYCLAPASSAAIPVHFHPHPSVAVEAHSFLRPVLRCCITSITHLFGFFHSRLNAYAPSPSDLAHAHFGGEPCSDSTHCCSHKLHHCF